MFKDPGYKLQILCKIIFWIGVIASIIGGITMVVYMAEADKIGLGLLFATAIIGLGILFSWLGVLVMFAFGRLVESTEEIAYYIRNTKRD